jgi:hypothetical protein
MLAQAGEAQARVDVQRYARQMVVDGGDPAARAILDMLLDETSDPWAALRSAEAMNRVGDALGAAMQDLARARAQVATSAATAEQAAQQARDGEETARRAQQQAQATVTAARDRLDQADATLMAAAGPGLQPLSMPSGTSQAGCAPASSVVALGNGQIPAALLCPLWGSPGNMLRTDAATAFNAMSKAYAARFGHPICVTDSYRSYAAQVDVRARKPTLAAVPGTSNHGWGLAVDLCDGVQTFGSPTHEWLRSAAPVFGWFHPAWAEPTGSKPEPWHFEFSPQLAAAMAGPTAP